MNARVPLQTASLAILGGAGFLAALVAERVVAALWQSYKFAGYSVGYITLSQRTAFYFLLCAAVLVATAFLVRRQSLSSGATLAARVAAASTNLVAASVFVYLLLALSPLNVWRA